MFDDSYLLPINELVESVQKDSSILKDIKKSIDTKNKNMANTLKNGVIKIYKDSPEVLASDVPSVGHLVRTGLLVGVSVAIHPLLGIFTLIADMVIKDSVDRKCLDKYISKYRSEIDSVNRQIDKTKNEKKKELLKKHLQDLEDGLSELELKRDSLDDEDKGIVVSKMKEINNESVIFEEALRMFRENVYQLSDEQFEYLISGNDYLLDEAKFITNIKKAVTRKEKKMDKWFNDTAREIKNKMANGKREEIVEGSFPKVSKLIKRAIILGATWAINPAISAITAFTMVVLSKAGTEAERKKLLTELGHELEMVEEKIKDADSVGDKEKKYELMRLKQKLQTNRDKVKRYI